MKHFKKGDYVIYLDEIFYVSKYLDLDGDFIFLTNSNVRGACELRKRNDYGNLLSEKLCEDLLKEMDILNYKYFVIYRRYLYSEIKIHIKSKIKNILNR